MANVTKIDGHTPNYVDPETRVPELLGVQISLTALALVIVLLRLYTRKIIRNAISLEDWVAAFTMLLAVTATILSCLGVLGGTGLHYYDVKPDVDKSFAAATSFANQVLYQPILQLTKVSMLLFYMASLGKSVRIPCYVLMTLSALLAISCTIVEFLQCKPVWMLWKGVRPQGYKCINQKEFFIVSGLINLVLDLAALVVPLPVLWKLNAPVQTRVALCLIFSVGLVSIAAEIARLVIWFGTSDGNRQNPDSTWNRVNIVNWSTVEYTTGIICASLPHLKALVAVILPGFFESILRSSRGASKALGSKPEEPSRTQHSAHSLQILSQNGKVTSHISSSDRRTATRLEDSDSEEYILQDRKRGDDGDSPQWPLG